MSKRKRTEFMKQSKTGARIFRKAAALLLAACLLWNAMISASAADAASLDLSRAGDSSITVTLRDEEGEAAGKGTLILYQVASLILDDGNMVYNFTEDFEDSGVSLTDVTGSASTLSETAQTFASYAEVGNLAGFQKETLSGTYTFTGLDLGLYLIVQEQAADGYQIVAPFLVTVPLADEETGDWIYDVDASPKTETLSEESPEEVPPEEPPEEEPPAEEPPEENPPREDPPDTVTDPPLPQTGQLNWPIPVLAAGGLLLVTLGGIMVLGDRRKVRG